MVKAFAKRVPARDAHGVGSASDHVLVQWNPDLSTALLYAVKTGGSDVYEVPGGFAKATCKALGKNHMPVYTCIVLSLENDPGETSKGVMRCKRFKRWLAPEK